MEPMNLLPCPFCGSKNISAYTGSIGPDCSIECDECGAMINCDVPWGNMTEAEHDEACRKELTKRWNRRVSNG